MCLLLSSDGGEVDGGEHDEKQEGGPLLRHGDKCDWLIRIQFHSVNGAIKDEHYSLLCQQDKRRELSVLAKYFSNSLIKSRQLKRQIGFGDLEDF